MADELLTKEAPEGEIDAAIKSLSALKEDKENFDSKLGKVDELVKKKNEIIEKLVDFHKKEIARVNKEKEDEVKKIKDALKRALMNDHG